MSVNMLGNHVTRGHADASLLKKPLIKASKEPGHMPAESTMDFEKQMMKIRSLLTGILKNDRHTNALM